MRSRFPVPRKWRRRESVPEVSSFGKEEASKDEDSEKIVERRALVWVKIWISNQTPGGDEGKTGRNAGQTVRKSEKCGRITILIGLQARVISNYGLEYHGIRE